jgi:uncharacterized membrane protein YtjA (UPF0391 family)
MMRLAVLFLVIALVAALLGFGGIAVLAWEGFKILALVFVVLAVLAFLAGGLRAPPA